MSHCGSRVMLGALVCVALLMATGCEELNQLKADKQELEAANTKLRNDKGKLEQENRQLRAGNETLLLKSEAKDKTITDLKALVEAGSEPAAGDDTGTGVTAADGMVTFTLAGDLLFDSGKAELKGSAKPSVARVAQEIKTKHGGKKIRVCGHTDSDPIVKSGWKDNWELSFHRARAVGLYLISQGVPTRRIELVGLANTEPRVSPEKTPADKAKNRRVVIQVVQ